jgi:CRISPR-associated protein Cas6
MGGDDDKVGRSADGKYMMAAELVTRSIDIDTSKSTSPNVEAQDMIDVVFDVAGTSVPNGYPFALWPALVQYLPWLKQESNAGIIPLRGSASGDDTLLSKRTKLVLRVPVERAAQASQLTGKQLDIDGSVLVVGKSKERPLQPSTTLHSYIVASNLSELEFLADMGDRLRAMNISCNLICDKYRKISDGKQTLSGFGLVLHDLKPAASIHLQRIGLGEARQYGCGIFVPFKAISGLD